MSTLTQFFGGGGGGGAAGESTLIIVETSNPSVPIPGDANYVAYAVMGGGGSGFRNPSPGTKALGGGGGGFSYKEGPVTGPFTAAFVIGAGGIGAPAPTVAPGGQSEVTGVPLGTITANGGETATAPTFPAGAAGGTATGGDINSSGGAGRLSPATPTVGGGGGGAGGLDGVGGASGQFAPSPLYGPAPASDFQTAGGGFGSGGGGGGLGDSYGGPAPSPQTILGGTLPVDAAQGGGYGLPAGIRSDPPSTTSGAGGAGYGGGATGGYKILSNVPTTISTVPGTPGFMLRFDNRGFVSKGKMYFGACGGGGAGSGTKFISQAGAGGGGGSNGGTSPFGGGSGGFNSPIPSANLTTACPTGRGGGAGGNNSPNDTQANGGAGAGMIEYWE